ncbi:MAG: hypothetical protein M1814_000141 [Vezdaea aestivalis]|nr:MAG: hypothetical protein M1814_000141 [Vezdaea aestivalis]
MLALALTADLTGVTNLRPKDTEDNPYYYTFKVQCTSCREIHPNWDVNEMSGSRGEANFVWKCKLCKRESTASIKIGPNPYKQESPPKPQNIIEIDCRGCEFVEFKSDGEWLASGFDSGSEFAGIDLIEEEWFEYDEKASEEVSVKDVKWEIIRAK